MKIVFVKHALFYCVAMLSCGISPHPLLSSLFQHLHFLGGGTSVEIFDCWGAVPVLLSAVPVSLGFGVMSDSALSTRMAMHIPR